MLPVDSVSEHELKSVIAAVDPHGAVVFAAATKRWVQCKRAERIDNPFVTNTSHQPHSVPRRMP